MIVRAMLIFVEPYVAGKLARSIFVMVFSFELIFSAPSFAESGCRDVGEPPERAARSEVFAHALKDTRVELGRATQQTLERVEAHAILKKLAAHSLVQRVQRGHHSIERFVDGRRRALGSRAQKFREARHLRHARRICVDLRKRRGIEQVSRERKVNEVRLPLQIPHMRSRAAEGERA